MEIRTSPRPLGLSLAKETQPSLGANQILLSQEEWSFIYNSDVRVSLTGNFTLCLSIDIFIPEQVQEAQQDKWKNKSPSCPPLFHGRPVSLQRHLLSPAPVYPSRESECIWVCVCVLSATDSMLFYTPDPFFFQLTVSWYSFPISTHRASSFFLMTAQSSTVMADL